MGEDLTAMLFGFSPWNTYWGMFVGHPEQFVVGRVILGIGVGQISVSIPVWQAECSSAAHRGRDVITAGIFMCVGYALCK